MQDVAGLAAQGGAGAGMVPYRCGTGLRRMWRLDFRALNSAGVHAMTLSAHKLGGPKGAGALVVDKRVELQPLIAGGGHERGLRSGTENVAAIVGLGRRRACGMPTRPAGASLAALRTTWRPACWRRARRSFAAAAERLPNTSYFAFRWHRRRNPGRQAGPCRFCRGAGAACSSANPEPSHVLLAMGVAPELARAAVRVSLGADNTVAQVRDFLGA
jgi:cysteine desulfurase